MPVPGDLYRLPDLLTGFSSTPEKHRWCVVLTADRYSVRVGPRSKTSEEGVLVPRDAAPDCFSGDGRFYDAWRSVAIADLRAYERRGTIGAPYLDLILAQYRGALERRRQHRQAGRGRGR